MQLKSFPNICMSALLLLFVGIRSKEHLKMTLLAWPTSFAYTYIQLGDRNIRGTKGPVSKRNRTSK